MSNAARTKKFREFTAKNYKDQAIAYLNAYWKDGADKMAEQCWIYVNKFADLDQKKKANGSDLDEFNSHRFLEFFKETKTVKALRQFLKDVDFDKNRRMSVLEYLLWKNNKTVTDFIARPQSGQNKKLIDEAQEKLTAANNALDKVIAELAEQDRLLKVSRQKEKESQIAKQNADDKKQKSEEAATKAKAALDKSQQEENRLRAAEEEVKKAVAELKAQEDAYNNKIKALEAKINNPKLGIVTKNRSRNELSQLKSQDPLPLRRAKITQNAALKKAERARKVAQAAKDKAKAAADAAKAALDAATQAAEAAAQALEAAKQAVAAVEQKKKEVEAAKIDAEKKVQEAQALLNKAKNAVGTPHGRIWWMERELTEKQRYLPKRLQKKL